MMCKYSDYVQICVEMQYRGDCKRVFSHKCVLFVIVHHLTLKVTVLVLVLSHDTTNGK